ncbi:MAG: phosphatase [Cytophagales bacterium]|nr:phosphatase [Cytophagales bacterium]
MKKFDLLRALYGNEGGEFILPATSLANKLASIKAYLFDWDGVFNGGVKGLNTHSTFSEIDVMGSNLLRLSHWLENNLLPLVAIITGEANKTARWLGEREHFDVVYWSIKNKKVALDHFCAQWDVQPQEIAFVFDDVLDLPLAQAVGLRFMVSNKANPLFKTYVRKKQLADYITGQPGNGYALREVTELMIGLRANYDTTLEERIGYTHRYQEYLTVKNKRTTACYTYENEAIIAATQTL